MEKKHTAEPVDPFSPDTENDIYGEAQGTGMRHKGRIFGYFWIALILGILLWVTDLLILFFDWRSFAALSLICVIYTVVMALAFVNSRAIYRKELSSYAREFHELEDSSFL